jgi:serine/threonine-protein kinase
MAEPVIEQRARARIGTTLNGKYRIDRLLGVGGMAAVYAATHRNNKRVAVKMLHPELSVHPQLRSRFMREGYVANAVDHPGAVAVLDDDVTEDGAAFLVMELLDGETLAEACDRLGGKLPVRAVLAVAAQVLDVLSAADGKHVVHRDIKPSNLFLTRTGHVKVLDFGVARMREIGPEHSTSSGLALGTPAFMAPEQALGRTDEIDGATDLWALGATMFALVTGAPVHAASTPQEQMVFAATRSAPSLAAADPEVPASVATLVDRALAFQRSARWPSADPMREAVREAYRALYGEDPAPSALVFMASPDKVPLSEAASLRSPMASTVPATPVTPVSSQPRRIDERLVAPSHTSLRPTTSLLSASGTGRTRLVVAAAAVVAVLGVAVFWAATHGAGGDGVAPAGRTSLSAMAGTVEIPSQREPAAAPIPPLEPTTAPSAAAIAPVARGRFVRTGPGASGAPAANALGGAPGAVASSATGPGGSAPAGAGAGATAPAASGSSAPVDRFDRQ